MTLHGDNKLPGHAAGVGRNLNGSAPTAQPAHPVLDAVCRSATELAGSVPTPPRRIRLRHGQTSVEIEWAEPREHQGTEAAGTAPRITSRTAGARPGDEPGEPPAETPHYVRAPTVGTFYRAQEPGAAPYVRVGDLVVPGQPVGVLEVMKMMSTIGSDVAGRVVEIVVGDAQPVEFDQRLIAVEPAAAAPAPDAGGE
ncbi:acetyl-CoA carboxylase biotin carboxyl carrier protein [Streptomyces sp. MI02-7b]|uniref:acetyl-CoA carboxylase biotin carboxyl carrier protein n=1 Tax=Streptomyces sp. MI02-7b TaxID=462941 RepID=UPI0029AFC0FA|nr:biotin/lipoyl-containing protein [Streptomyces sp. MI02-7b]MDX3073134.1 acetyl-CoA carboxylase biotin carboxyl carrier protein subunit [Streptomyces sp. MI02-7b]